MAHLVDPSSGDGDCQSIPGEELDHNGNEAVVGSNADKIAGQGDATAVSHVSSTSHHATASDLATADTSDANFRSDSTSLGPATRDGKLPQRHIGPSVHASEKTTKTLTPAGAGATSSYGLAQSGSKVPPTRATMNAVSAIAPDADADADKQKHAINSPDAKKRKDSSKTRAGIDADITNGTQPIRPQKGKVNEHGNDNSGQSTSPPLATPSAQDIAERDDDVSFDAEIHDERLVEETSPSGTHLTQRRGSTGHAAAQSQAALGAYGMDVIPSNAMDNGNAEIAIIDADIEGGHGTLTSAQVPIAADLAPDTDKIVRQAIQQDRARRNLEQPVLVNSQPIDEAQAKRNARTMRCGLLALCLIVIAVAVSLAVTLTQTDGDGGKAKEVPIIIVNRTEAPTMSAQPTGTPTASPTTAQSMSPSSQPSQQPTVSDYGVLVERLVAATNGSMSAFDDMSSPQSRAARWLLEDGFFAIGDADSDDGVVIVEFFSSATSPGADRADNAAADATVAGPSSTTTLGSGIDDTTADSSNSTTNSTTGIDGPAILSIEWNETTTKQIVERYASAVFYYATGGETWASQLNFLTNKSVCDWGRDGFTQIDTPHGPIVSLDFFGIRCSPGGHPHTINFRSFYQDMLVGTLPTEIGLLEELIHVGFDSQVWIHGTIPTELGNLKKLKVLWLSLERLEGTLPTELASLPLLRDLILSNTKLSGNVTFHEGDLASLDNLELDDTRWESTIPQGIGYLTQLTELSMRNTAMQGTIPSDIGRLTSLKKLVLDGCRVKGPIPTEVGNMTSLRALSFEHSHFLDGPIPSEIGRLVKLTQLDFACTNINGVIPDTLTQLTKLKDFDISGATLNGRIPQAFCSQPSDPFGTFANLEITNCDVEWTGFGGSLISTSSINCSQFDASDPTIVMNCCECSPDPDHVDIGVRTCGNTLSCIED